MRIDHSAGGIVIRRKPQLQILTIQDSHGNWSFPKGGIEDGETPLQAAQREISEEVGLTNLQPIRSLGRVEFWFKDRWQEPGQKVKKYVEYFLLEDTDNQHPQANNEEGILDAVWLNPEVLLKKLSYKNLNVIIDRSLKTLND